MTRTAKAVRATAETDIGLSVDLDGTGAYDVETGVGFFDHMLAAFSRHSLVDLTARVKGDVEVDDHHTVEDTGIGLGQALREALGDKRGVQVWPSAANFLLVRVPRAAEVRRRLRDEFSVLVRDFSAAPGLGGCLRISVGTREENDVLLDALATLVREEA